MGPYPLSLRDFDFWYLDADQDMYIMWWDDLTLIYSAVGISLCSVQAYTHFGMLHNQITFCLPFTARATPFLKPLGTKDGVPVSQWMWESTSCPAPTPGPPVLDQLCVDPSSIIIIIFNSPS
jgi:hypothetical protein